MVDRIEIQGRPLVEGMLEEASEWDLAVLKAVLRYQYGAGAEEVLGGPVAVERSERTGRMRHVYVGGKMVATIRASDGFLVLTLEGARLMLSALPPPRARVIAHPEAVPFVARGRSLFAKHVVDADDEIRAGDEVIVVDREDRLVAVGRAVLSGWEMKELKRGVAVRIRRGVAEED